ncbi:MAG: beta-glucosidase [Clostridiaceae bacterium]|nr:beta-glucosidase [Clostridiaceae bacterium]
MALYQDANCPIKERVDDLLSRMTRAEKLGQLRMKLYGWQCYEKTAEGEYQLTDSFTSEVHRNKGLGGLYGVLRADPWSGVNSQNGIPFHFAARVTNLVQAYVLAHSRLGIPTLFIEECPHGLQGLDGINYPANLGAACSFNPALRKENYAHIATEMRARGAHVGIASTLDLLCDPRWGRSEECYGEDPFLASRMTEAVTTGLQGDTLADLTRQDKLAVQLEHYAAQGSAIGGHNGGASNIGERELREQHLPMMKAGCGANAQTVTSAYTAVDGVFCNASRFLMTNVLREELGFDGFVLSDGGAVDNLTILTGGLSAGKNDPAALTKAAALALNAGVDTALWGSAFDYLEDACTQNLVSIETVDEAVRRVLRVKFRLGLFEKPFTDEHAWEQVNLLAARHSARDMARESIVLFKNNGLLPIAPAGKKIAVIGPNAHCLYNQLGDYTAEQKAGTGVTPLDGIKALAKSASWVRYARGCGIRNPSKDGFAAAVRLAQDADCVMLVLGGSSARDFGTKADENGTIITGDDQEMDCGEGRDVASLALGGVQEQLAREIVATGTPVVVILIEGRPHAVEWLSEHCPAMISAWYPGIEGGTAIAEVLFGFVNPSGKLAASVAHGAGQLPVSYNRYPHYPARYVDRDDTPRYPFGFGLSYTRFTFSDLKVSSPLTVAQLEHGERVNVQVDIQNSGDRAGAEVVQLYVRDLEASVLRRVKELKGFAKVFLQPGEKKTVVLTLGFDELALFDASMTYLVEPGRFMLWVTNGVDQTLESDWQVLSA